MTERDVEPACTATTAPPAGGGSIADAVGRAVGCVHAPAARRAPAWPAVTAAQIQRHRVGALLHGSGLMDAASASEATRAKLASDAVRARRDAARALALQRELVARLEEEAIAVVVLKGPAVALRAYGDVALRHVGDLDLLVAAEQVARTVDALHAAGFAPAGLELPPFLDWRSALPAVLATPQRFPLVKAVSLRRGPGEHVEVHWRLFRNEHLLPVDPEWLARPDRLDVGGSSTPVLPLEVLWRYLLVHGAEDRWPRLKWLADIPALSLRHPQLTSPPALRAVEDEGLARCVAGGLLLGEQVLGRFLGDGARRWARSVRGTLTLRSSALVALRRGDRRTLLPAPDLPRHVATQLSLRADGRYRRAEVRNLLVQAGRAQLVPDPGTGTLAAAPGRWAAGAITAGRSTARR